MACCGKLICSGCIYAPLYDNQGNELDKKCPLCRSSPPSCYEEIIERYKKRMELDDPIAICDLGSFYNVGVNGLSQNHAKALELYHQAAELGHSEAYYNIGNVYYNGNGVELDKKKARYYWELSAIGGHPYSRHNLGGAEEVSGNMDRALKHWMIAAKDGEKLSLENIKDLCKRGYATKDDYGKALCCYQSYLDEIKTDQRDEAVHANGNSYY